MLLTRIPGSEDCHLRGPSQNSHQTGGRREVEVHGLTLGRLRMPCSRAGLLLLQPLLLASASDPDFIPALGTCGRWARWCGWCLPGPERPRVGRDAFGPGGGERGDGRRGEKCLPCPLFVTCWGCSVNNGLGRGWWDGAWGGKKKDKNRVCLLSVRAGRGEYTGEDMLMSPLFSQPAFAVSLISSVPLFAAGI